MKEIVVKLQLIVFFLFDDFLQFSKKKCFIYLIINRIKVIVDLFKYIVSQLEIFQR